MKIKYLSILPIVAVFVFSGISLAQAQSDVFTQNLYYGLQNNSQVTQLQEFLTAQGFYSGPITGNFYFLTLGAVKAFQTQQGIAPAAGYFGPLTMAAANRIADAAVGASNAEAISETGTSTPPTLPSSTVQLQLQALLQEVALLQQQLQTQQSSTQVIQTLQTQVQQQTQTIQQQSQTLQQIQQNTQAIQQNTTPAPSNNPTPQPPAPTPIQISSAYTMKIVPDNGPNDLKKTYLSSPLVQSLDTAPSSYFYADLEAELVDGNGMPVKTAVVNVTTDDPTQNKTINGTGDETTGNSGIFVYPFSYVFKTVGQHTITFTAPALNASTSITLQSVAGTPPVLTIGLDSSSGNAPQSIATGSTGNPLVVFRISETSNDGDGEAGDGRITSLTITDLTSSTQPVFSNLMLWEGASEVGTAGSATPLPSGNGYSYTFDLGTYGITVPAASSISLTLKGDVASSITASSTHVFEIANASDVTVPLFETAPQSGVIAPNDSVILSSGFAAPIGNSITVGAAGQ